MAPAAEEAPPLAARVELPPDISPPRAPPLARPAAPAEVPGTPPVASRPDSAVLATMGIDPASGRVVDPARFRQWQQQQHRQAAQELPPPPPGDPDPFRTARKQLAAWFDLPRNQQRLATGDAAGLRHDPVLREYLGTFQRFGADKAARLAEYVDFLIDNRVKKDSWGP